MNVLGTESVSNGGIKAQEGALDTPEDAGKGKAGVVARWLAELALADKVEKDWRADANRVRDIYRGDKATQNSFNIVWANTEVILPNLYNSPPKPDVRRRYRDEDPVGKAVATVLERALAFESDCSDFDGVMKAAVFDSVLPGRGLARVRYSPTFEDQEDTDGKPVLDSEGKPQRKLTSAKLEVEPWPWDRFRRGPASQWRYVPWIAYLHEMTMGDIDDKFPGFSSKVNYDVTVKGADEDKANAEPSVFKRVTVWEIHDKEGRNVLWIAPSCETEPLLEEGDKLGLKDFFDMPQPIYSIEDTSTLEPVCDYKLYEDQAKELNRVTQRINKLTEALKVRGIYDSTLSELGDIMSGDDNEIVPTKNSTIALQAGGFEKAIWLLPIEKIALVLKQLYVQREQIKMTIYEVTGISDILRGQSDPNETLGAQELKVQSGSVRIKRRQRDVQRFARDLFRIMAEIISEHYQPEMLTMMTGIAVTPEMLTVLRRDLLRGIKVDIETDSTIAADDAAMRRDARELLEGIGGFMQAFGPAVQSGAISEEAAKKIFVSIIRKARMGRDVEDAIEAEAAKPQQPKTDPAVLAQQQAAAQQQAEMQQKQAQAAADNQIKQLQAQADAELALAEANNAFQLKIKEAEADAALKLKYAEAEIALKQFEAEALIAIKQKESEALIQLKREQALAGVELQREQQLIDVEKDEATNSGVTE